jgi:prepilin-type N-terminal cleavage/methylation domain-containing protein
MKRRGLTLIELLVAISIVVILAMAITRAYAAGLDHIQHAQATREVDEARLQFEDKLTKLLRSAVLSSNATDTSSFFIGESSGLGGGGTLGANADTLVFTAIGARPAGAYLASQDDFETNNQRFGPQGGMAEIQLSTTAVGDAGDKEGLFLREQRPADGDPTQGGMESLMTDQVRSISFEFYDGADWQPLWDTQTQQTPRLPAAIRVSYTLEGDDENQPRVLIVRLPTSDVTADNPVVQGGATQ